MTSWLDCLVAGMEKAHLEDAAKTASMGGRPPWECHVPTTPRPNTTSGHDDDAGEAPCLICDGDHHHRDCTAPRPRRKRARCAICLGPCLLDGSRKHRACEWKNDRRSRCAYCNVPGHWRKQCPIYFVPIAKPNSERGQQSDPASAESNVAHYSDGRVLRRSATAKANSCPPPF